MSVVAEHHVEEHRVAGDKLLAKVRQLVHHGDVRRLIVKTDAGATLMEIPLTVGIVGAMVLPVRVALGAMGAMAPHYRIVVETMDEPVEAKTDADAWASEAFAFTGRPEGGDPVDRATLGHRRER